MDNIHHQSFNVIGLLLAESQSHLMISTYVELNGSVVFTEAGVLQFACVGVKRKLAVINRTNKLDLWINVIYNAYNILRQSIFLC